MELRIVKPDLSSPGHVVWVWMLALCLASACTSDERTVPEGTFQQEPEPEDEVNNGQDPPMDEEEPDPEGPEGPLRATLTHSFGQYNLEPFEETSPCVSWTLNNDEPIYVERVTQSNSGSYHHSNWFVVPEDEYPGRDGYWRCRSRGFQEVEAALLGTVLFAQSTQSLVESQHLGDGVVIKIPPRHKVVANVHMLNLAPREQSTELRMALDLVHPHEVETVVTPFRLSYLDLTIPGRSRSLHTSDCMLRRPYERTARRDYDIKLYWVLPHYHQLGDYFKLEIIGGARDGEVIYELEGFNADANGKAFEEPLDLSDSDGLRFTCGYTNTGVRSVGWGIGDQEMCVMLGFMDAGALIDASVIQGSEVVEVDGNTVYNQGPCSAYGLPRNAAQTMPTDEERKAPLYVPEGNGPDELAPVIDCQDTPADAVAEAPVSFENIQNTIFASGCAFNACHDAEAPAATLPLVGDGAYDALLAHPARGNRDMPMITPGDPDQSWLYQIISRCEPTNHDGEVVAHMPLNAPTLMDPELVAKVRDWITAGAPR